MGRKRHGQPIHGWIVLDKPLHLTSSQAVGAVKRLLQPQKIGHGGTLDPLATGVLPLALGEATKVMSFAMDSSKTYRFTVAWGEARDTDDREGVVTSTSDVRPDAEDIKKVMGRFTGSIVQTPPAYSALKVGGRRAYDLARKGGNPALKARDVIVHDLILIETRTDDADFEVVCGKGTYVRALARDIAVAIGTCGHISSLRRTRVGPFDEADAFSLDKLEQLSHIAPPERYLRPIETPLDDIPEVAVMESEANRLRQGQTVSVPHRLDGEVLITTLSGVVENSRKRLLVGLGVVEEGILRPKRVFNL